MNSVQQIWDDANESKMSCEVLIIGSGAGGSPTAALLAEAGFDVLVVEEGRWVEQGTVAAFSLYQIEQQYRGGGVTVAHGLPSIAYTEGRCAGGGTEVNSGLYRRPPTEVVERWRDRWDVRDLDPDELMKTATEVETDIHVTHLPGPASVPSQLLRQGADALGWKHDESPRWMTYPDGNPRHGQRQSMTRTYLPRAAKAGARILTQCRVNKINISHAKATSADVSLASGQAGTISFKFVFVCGGAIQTPAILQRS